MSEGLTFPPDPRCAFRSGEGVRCPLGAERHGDRMLVRHEFVPTTDRETLNPDEWHVVGGCIYCVGKHDVREATFLNGKKVMRILAAPRS